MTDRHDDLRVAPDPSRAEDLRRHLRARLAGGSGGEPVVPMSTALPEADRDDRGGDLVLLEPEDRPAQHPLRVDRRPSPGRWLLTAAAVLVALVGALLVVEGDDEHVGTVTAPPTSADGSLPVGRHVIVSTRDELNEDRVPVSIPAPGWFAERDDGALTKDLGGGDRVTIVVVPGDYYNVPEDICSWRSGGALVSPSDGSTDAEALVAVLREQTFDTPQGPRTRDLTDPVDISIDGNRGESVTGALPESAPRGCDERRFCSLLDRDGARCLLPHLEPGALVTFWITDRPGPNSDVIVVAATFWPTTSSELLAETNAIIDSMEHEP